MESHRSPNCNYQVAHQHSTDNDHRDLNSLLPTAPPRTQQPDDSDLFTILLFNRQCAYKTTPLSPSWARELTSTERRFLESNADTPSAPQLMYTSSGDEKVLPCNNTSAYISQSRAMPPKKAAVSEKKKPVAKVTLDKTIGRTTVSKKPVKSVGVAVVKRATTKTVATKASSKQKPSERSRNGTSKTASKAVVQEDEDTIMILSDDNIETDKETNEAKSTHSLRAFDAAKARIRQLKEQAEKAQRELLAEQEKTKTLQTEKDELTCLITALKADKQDYINEMLATEEERLNLKTQNANLTTQLKQLATQKEDVVSAKLQLGTENILLRDENRRLKESSSSASTAAPPPTLQSTSTSTLLPASPAPSSIVFAEEDVKLDNVRKVYAQLKRKQDSLKGIARQIMWCTKNMVLGEFGEFGVTVRRLREWMEEDEQQQGTKKQKQSVGTGG